MQQPLESDDSLRVVHQEEVEQLSDESVITNIGGGPPRNSLSWLWFLCALGALLMVLSWLALSFDPACPLNSGSTHPGLMSGLRVWFEQVIFLIGSATTVTSITVLCNHAKAKRLESDARLRSLQAKRIEKMSEKKVGSVIASYVSGLINGL